MQLLNLQKSSSLEKKLQLRHQLVFLLMHDNYERKAFVCSNSVWLEIITVYSEHNVRLEEDRLLIFICKGAFSRFEISRALLAQPSETGSCLAFGVDKLKYDCVNLN